MAWAYVTLAIAVKALLHLQDPINANAVREDENRPDHEPFRHDSRRG